MKRYNPQILKDCQTKMHYLKSLQERQVKPMMIPIGVGSDPD